MNQPFSFTPVGGFGENDNRRMPRQVPQHHTFSQFGANGHANFDSMASRDGKRHRDSPTSDTDGSWQSSFKRLRMMDDTSDTFSTMTNPSSLRSSPVYENSIERDDENLHASQFTPVPAYLAPPIQRQVTLDKGEQQAGQKSMGPDSSYQSMNSLLGNLHAMRRQRASQSTGQPPSQLATHQQLSMEASMPSYYNHNSTRPRPSGKKKTSLRVSSNLY